VTDGGSGLYLSFQEKGIHRRNKTKLDQLPQY
jgi:hypothetical protein